MKCVIIDDEPLAVDLIKEFVSKVESLELINTFNNAIDAIAMINTSNVDLIFFRHRNASFFRNRFPKCD